MAFALYQNTPNPFKGDCNIRFDLPSDMEAQLSIYNPQGAMIYQLEIDGVKGVNTVTLSSYNLNTSGVLLYVVQAGPYKATKKMVIIEKIFSLLVVPLE